MNEHDISAIVKIIQEKYGYDFSHYARSSQYRRFDYILSKYKLEISELKKRLSDDGNFFLTILNDLTICVSDFFRDASVYAKIKELIFPYLETYSTIKIWHAGCSTGEEVYSLAILLQEAGIYPHCQIYATDINPFALKKAKSGIYPNSVLKKGEKAYAEAGGIHTFSQYFTEKYEYIAINKELKDSIVFSEHNLVADSAFGEMQLILCRNVLIYFDLEFQNTSINLFTESLCPNGFLCLGTKENLSFLEQASNYQCVAKQEKIYQKRLFQEYIRKADER